VLDEIVHTLSEVIPEILKQTIKRDGSSSMNQAHTLTAIIFTGGQEARHEH